MINITNSNPMILLNKKIKFFCEYTFLNKILSIFKIGVIAEL